MLAKALQGATAAADKLYIEDVMSTYLYTGNGSTQTITNGVDLAGKDGLVWIKGRSNTFSAALIDTVRGGTSRLRSALTDAADTGGNLSFLSTGFQLTDGNALTNGSNVTYASWTFREAAKFFDVVTYTGNGTSQSIAHNLGSEPGFVIIKATSTSGNWVCYHRSLGTGNAVFLSLTNASAAASDISAVSSTTFSVSGSQPRSNESGQTYVAYLFAHDAGGFGASGNDNVVSCGSFQDGPSFSGQLVNLGWEPQWVMIKRIGNADVNSTFSANWQIYDVMRGLGVDNNLAKILRANTTEAEISNQSTLKITSQGFVPNLWVNTNDTYIYIAIRRGPMKTPTDATKVFSANAFTSSANGVTTTGFPPDLVLYANRDRTAFSNSRIADRLRGAITSGSGQTLDLMTESTSGEGAVISNIVSTDNVSFKWQSGTTGYSIVSESFRRAPGFFDVVAYTGTGANQQVTHNLGVVPEMMIIKSRSGAFGWAVYHSGMGTDLIELQSNIYGSSANPNWWDNGAPTSTLIKTPTGSNAAANRSGDTFVAYLFSSCPGVSKVGSYTGTATTLSIDCGFTNGARFVLIRRKNAGGDWYVWDTARGIVSGNDSYLLLNSTAAEVTNTDYIDPLSSGFQISSTAPAAINANGGSFIYLAVA